MATRLKKKPTTKKAFPKASKRSSPKTSIPPTIDSVWALSSKALSVLWQNKKLFSGIMLIYGIAYLFIVQGLATTSTSASTFHSTISKIFSGVATFALFFGASSSTSANPAGNSYQATFILIISLVLIWTLRQLYSGKRVRVRDGYYKALFPFIPFLLILLFVGLELLPFVIGTEVYSVLISNGINITPVEKLIAIMSLIGLILFSLYLVSSSIFALYIVTLPNMTPIKALRSAKGLVKGRRILIMRKVLFLPVALIAATSIVLLPFILIYPASVTWATFVLSLFIIAAVHAYLYNLYRELIK